MNCEKAEAQYILAWEIKLECKTQETVEQLAESG